MECCYRANKIQLRVLIKMVTYLGLRNKIKRFCKLRHRHLTNILIYVVGMTMIPLKDYKGEIVNTYFDKNILKIIGKGRINVLSKNQSLVFIVDGKSGIGKSTEAIKYCFKCDPNFNLSKVAFTPHQFLELILNATRGDSILFDEAMGMMAGNTLSKASKDIVIAMSMIRSKNIFVFICINSIFDLNKSLALHRAQALIHLCRQFDSSDGRLMIKFYGRDTIKKLYINGKKFYNYSTRPNFMAEPGKFHFLLDPISYEKKKQDAIRSFGSNNNNDPSSRIEKKYKNLFVDALLLNKFLHGMDYRAQSNIFNTPTSSLSTLLQECKDDGRYDEVVKKIKEFKKQNEETIK